MTRTNQILGAAIILAGFTTTAGLLMADEPRFGMQAVTMTTITNATGTIVQANYNESGGAVQSFLLSGNVVLSFTSAPCAGVASLGAAGNSVTYSGTGVMYASGFQSVTVTSLTNARTGVTYAQPVTVKPTPYATTAGVIKQLNYHFDGTVNGFLFTPTGGASAIFIDIGPFSNSTLTPLLKVGAAVSVTGTLEPPVACSAAGTPSEVDASSLTFGTTTVKIGPVSFGTIFGGRF